MDFIFNRSKGGTQWDPPPYIRSCFKEYKFNLSSWGTNEKWPRKQVQVRALLKGLSGSSAGLYPGLSHDRHVLNH